MHIKIVDYNTSELKKIQALNLIIERVYNNYFNERSKYKGEFLDLTPDLQIDSQLGTVYSSCPYDIFSLLEEIFLISNEIKLFVVFDVSKQVGFWEDELYNRKELFFGFFYFFADNVQGAAGDKPFHLFWRKCMHCLKLNILATALMNNATNCLIWDWWHLANTDRVILAN